MGFRIFDMGLLAIFFVTMMVPADAAMGYECNIKLHNMTTVSFASVMGKIDISHTKSFGTAHPDEYAYQILGGPGYIAIMEEDKFMKCEPMIVTLQPQDKCYDRLPILKGGQKLFLTPWTHIISEHANEISCELPILEDYELEATTYKVLPRPVYSLEPKQMKRETKLPWEYQELEGLANRGIYPEKNMQDLLDHMKYPAQFSPPPPTVYVFSDADGNTPNVTNLNRDAYHVEWYRYWNTYSILAVTAVVLVGIFVCGCIVKMVADKINHGSALHSVNGAFA